MALFDPDHTPTASPEDAIAIVHHFLRRCKAWADKEELPKRIERVATDPTPDNAASLFQWSSYADFTEHALHEVESGTLDHWFTAPNVPDE